MHCKLLVDPFDVRRDGVREHVEEFRDLVEAESLRNVREHFGFARRQDSDLALSLCGL